LQQKKELQLSRFKKLSQTIWHCQYHIVWVPKYRYRILTGEIKRDVENLLRAFSHQERCEIIEVNVQIDHIHLLVMIPPKISISSYMGKLKGKIAIRILNKFKDLKQKRYWGNHFWARGYCVDTVGLDSEMIRKYVKYQEKKERREEQQNRLF
jgi:putative transposase